MNLKLYDYQIEALNKLDDISVLGFEAGLGKTITSLYWLLEKNQPHNWIVCSKVKLNEWIEDAKNLNINLEIYKKGDSIKKYNLINYEMFHRIQKNLDLSNQLLIFDECQKINGSNSKIFLSIKKANFKYMLFLSGTFHSVGYQNLGNLFVLLKLVRSVYEFENKYLIIKQERIQHFNIKKVVGYKNLEELKNQLHSKGVFFKKPSSTVKIEYPINILKNEEYNLLLKNSVLDFFISPNKAVKFNALRMVCSNFIQQDERLKFYKPLKIERLKFLLSVDLKNERLIIFYNFVAEFEEIKKLLEKINRPYSYINGNGQNRKNFINHKNGIILCQYKSASEGINGLQITNHTLFYSPPLSGGLFEQAQKRTDRIGQENEIVYYYYFITINSVEELIYENLKYYKDITSNLFKKI